MKPIQNQKRVTIHKEVVEKDSGKKRPYMIAYVDTIEKAAQELKNSAFKVYMSLLANQNNYYYGLSPQAIANHYGISVDAARDGIKQLLEYGYLERDTENEYFFYDRVDTKPVELAEEIEMNQEKRTFHKKDGSLVEYTYAEIYEAYGERAKDIWEKGSKE